MSNVVTADVMLVPAEAAAQTADGPQLKKWGFKLRTALGRLHVDTWACAAVEATTRLAPALQIAIAATAAPRFNRPRGRKSWL